MIGLLREQGQTCMKMIEYRAVPHLESVTLNLLLMSSKHQELLQTANG
jgi:hypothetical protein